MHGSTPMPNLRLAVNPTPTSSLRSTLLRPMRTCHSTPTPCSQFAPAPVLAPVPVLTPAGTPLQRTQAFDGKEGRPKYPQRWIMLPPFF